MSPHGMEGSRIAALRGFLVGASHSSRGESRRLIVGVLVAVATIVGLRFSTGLMEANSDLYSFAVVSLLMAAGALIAEPLGIAAAIVELSLGFIAGLFGAPKSALVDSLGLIGSVFIMYMAGVEIDPLVLKRYLAPSVASGLASFLAPMSVTYLALSILGYSHLESLLTSIGVSTTSVAVVYAIIRRHGLLRRRRGQIVLAVAMVADVASILAFVYAASAHSLSMAAYFVATAVSPFLVARAFDALAGGEYEVELRLVLASLVAASLLGEYFGVHAILFAFLLGVATRKTIVRRPSLLEKMTALTFGLLAPIFFVNAGLHASPRNPLLYLELTILLLIVSLPLKIASTHYAIRFSTGERLHPRITSVFGARLTVSTVIAFAGEASGILSHDLAGSIILSALAATIISALIAGRGVLGEEALAG